MKKKLSPRERSLGEAHLYIAVAKADGLVSKSEQARAPYHARRSQKLFNIMKANEKVLKTIRDDVVGILGDPRYSSWNSEAHLTEALKHFTAARNQGDWTVKYIGKKNKEGLLQLAILDGYNVKESRFLKKISVELGKLD